MIGTLQLFNEPQIMHALAPAVIGDHYTPNVYAYTLAFTNQQYNYSAAVSFVLGRGRRRHRPTCSCWHARGGDRMA